MAMAALRPLPSPSEVTESFESQSDAPPFSVPAPRADPVAARLGPPTVWLRHLLRILSTFAHQIPREPMPVDAASRSAFAVDIIRPAWLNCSSRTIADQP